MRDLCGRMLGTLAGALLLVAVPVGAQTTGADSARADSVAVRLRAIDVSAARAVGVVGGASAVVVRPDAMRASPAPLLEQALRETPFVHVRQNSRGEMELSVRGSDSRQAAVLLDGVPITLGWDHRTDPSLVPVTGTQRLVVVRGLGSLLNGPNTLGGTIEVSHTESAVGTRIWGGAGADENSAFVTSAGGSRRLENVFGGFLTVQGGLAYRKRDGFALPDGAKDSTARDGLRTNSDLRHSDGFASLRWSSAGGQTLGVTLTGFDAERGVPPEEHISAPRLWRYPYHSRWLAALSGSTGNFRTPLGEASLELSGGYNSGRVKIESYSNRGYTNVTGVERGAERTASGRVLLTQSLPMQATLRAAWTGADVRYTETLAPAAGDEYQQTMWSAGGELEIELGRTTLAGGAVYDRTTTPRTGGRAAQTPFDNVGWRAGLTHDRGSFRLHASANRRSRFPALRELYSGALNRFMPNPDLKPETLLGLEAGFATSQDLSENARATFEFTTFRNQLDDAVVRITLPAPDRRFLRINRDRIESSGVELLAGVNLGAVQSRSVTVTLDALLQQIAIQDVTLAGQPERHAENNPEARASLEIGAPLPLRLRLTTNSRYTGRQYCLNADTGSEMTLAAQAEHDLALERGFAVSGRGAFSSLRALIGIDNVANTTIYDQCGLPQPGRTLRVMFTLR